MKPTRQSKCSTARNFKVVSSLSTSRGLVKSDRLVRAAVEEFATRGYHRTSVEDIVRSARTSRTAFYAFFDNREDAMYGALQTSLRGLLDEVRDKLLHADPERNITEVGISAYVNWLVADPAALVDAPRTGRRLPGVLGEAAVARLIATPPDTPRGRRDAAMIELAYGSGLRVSELVMLPLADVNLHGGFLEFMETERYPTDGTELELTNLVSGNKAKARVSGIRRSSQDAPLGVAVELLPPMEEFWGLTFQLRKSTEELLKLEHGIKSGEIDPYVLREFRDAVDHIRKTAWAVQEWQERQVLKRDTATVIPLLVTERIRRGTQLYEALTEDLKSRTIRPEAAEIEDLLRAIERLREELKQLH